MIINQNELRNANIKVNYIKEIQKQDMTTKRNYRVFTAYVPYYHEKL